MYFQTAFRIYTHPVNPNVLACGLLKLAHNVPPSLPKFPHQSSKRSLRTPWLHRTVFQTEAWQKLWFPIWNTNLQSEEIVFSLRFKIKETIGAQEQSLSCKIMTSFLVVFSSQKWGEGRVSWECMHWVGSEGLSPKLVRWSHRFRHCLGNPICLGQIW